MAREAKRFAGSHGAESCKKRVEHAILLVGFLENRFHSFPVCAWLALVLHHGRVNEFLAPLTRKHRFPVFIKG